MESEIKQYEEKGYSEKEALNIRTEELKLTDIEYFNKNILLALSSHLKKFLITWQWQTTTDDVKNKCIYVEVRLTKKTCLSLKSSSSIFKLSAEINLTSYEYARNLITYFDNFHSQKSITITNLQNVLSALNQKTVSKNQTTLDSWCFRSGDYFAAFWVDGNIKY